MPIKQYRKPARTYEDIRAEWVGTKQRPGHLVAWWWAWKVTRQGCLVMERAPRSVLLSFVFELQKFGRGRRTDDDDVIGAGLKLALDAAVVAGIWPDDGPSHVRIAEVQVYEGGLPGMGVSLMMNVPDVHPLPKPLPTLNELIDAAKFSGMKMARKLAVVRR